MGELWVPMLLDDKMKEWLQSERVAFPEAAPATRWPTPAELRRVLDNLPGFRVTYRSNSEQGWDAEVVDAHRGYDGMSVIVWTKDVLDDDEAIEFGFHKPWLELALTILERLSRTCGTFVLVQGSSGRPAVIAPGCDVTGIASAFE